MMAGIAHEINNPVNFIYGNLKPANGYFQDLIGLVEHYQECYPNPKQELQEHLDTLDVEFMTEDAYKLLESLKIGADRIRQIVLSLRNFSRLDEAKMKAVNIHEGIDSTLLILQSRLWGKAGAQAVEVVKECGDLPPVECYPSQLNQVFMNIVVNAVDALEEYASGKPPNEVAIPSIHICTAVAANKTVLIQITDNGPGIPKDIRKKLFDPFFTTKPVGKGTGLGLSISHEIVVKKHKGSISCVAISEGGTRFLIEIPSQQSNQPAQPIPPQASKALQTSMP
ncbi:MAG: sensor histidine kinase [Phormidesmis sp.]